MVTRLTFQKKKTTISRAYILRKVINVEILKAIAADFSASSIWYSSYLPATKLRNLFVLMTVGVHVAASTCSRCLAKMAASSLRGTFIAYGTELMLLKHFHVYKILHQLIIFFPIWFRF